MAKSRGPKWVDVPLIEAGPVAVGPEAELLALRDDLVRLERERAALLERRGRLVERLRAEGRTWAEVVVLAGVSRPALLKRG